MLHPRSYSHPIVRWLVETVPNTFNSVLQWLNRSQLFLLVAAMLLLILPLITARPSLWQQTGIVVVLVLVGRGVMYLEQKDIDRRSREGLHLFLMMMSVIATLRYFYYRTAYTLNLNHWVEASFSLLLYMAELYGILTLFLAYFQTVKIRDRRPVDLTTLPPEAWLTVDIYIPTYNESVDIVRKTVLAAVALDYPAEKKRVYVLDDGRAEQYRDRREQLRQICEELGCTMLTRNNNDHAKAGNINTALYRTQGDLVLILDCDHIPIRSFLKETVGFFQNPNVSLVQTPHWFYNSDPFERNLLTSGRVPVGNELFYKVLQKGNDFWNAAFFCGSAAIIRREHLLEVGGIATETVTEDCHTSLRLHSCGYETVYYDKIMVAGLAPEKFSSYVGQQVRWARGMAQILRTENPLMNLKLKLTLPQRLCYFSATSHFFFGFPRLMFAIAPNMFLLFNISLVRGLGLETLLYALPHIVLSMQTNYIPYKHVRFSFWNEIYEFAMSFQAGIVTLLALINPRLGSFNVTDKGLKVEERSFDLGSVRYLVILAALTAASLVSVPFWLVLKPMDAQAVLINALWAVVNLFLLLAACLVAFEQPQLRRAHRMPRQLRVTLHSEQESWTGTTTNISDTGAQILLDVWPNIPDEVWVELEGDYGARALLNARVVRGIATGKLETLLAVDFINPSQTQLDDLTRVVYSDVRQWYSQQRRDIDSPLQSIQFIATSLKRVFRELQPETGVKVRKQVHAQAQLFWEGWEGWSYPATVLEMSTREVRLEVEGNPIFNLDAIATTKPLIGMLLGQGSANLQQSLIAQVQSVEPLNGLFNSAEAVESVASLSQRVAFEMVFPESLDRQQHSKIKQLLRSLQ
jgi:cellulose synthase (UDP-forming)